MDGTQRLQQAGLEITPNRLLIVESLEQAGGAVTPQELQTRVGPRMNRVTLYRILDLLVDHGVVHRHSAGERAFRYCLGQPGATHCHFHCRSCGRTQCLPPDSVQLDLSALARTLDARIERTEVCLDGLCAACLAAQD